MPRDYRFFVYIMSSKSRRIYTGVTNNIGRRVAQHKAGEIKGFTQQYKIDRLVYFEVFHYVGNAIRREKAIKHWVRAERVALIERENPTWEDLAEDWGEPIEPLKPHVVEGKADPPRQGREG
jgi:putative endonuclease